MGVLRNKLNDTLGSTSFEREARCESPIAKFTNNFPKSL